MATLSDMVDRLIREASVDSDDTDLTKDNNLLINQIVTDALTEHNPTVTFSALPDNERQLVTLLGWIKVCHVRAGRVADDPNLTGAGGYGQDRESAFAKNMKLAERLKERYDLLVSRLGVTGPELSGSGTISVSSLKITEDRSNLTVPNTRAVVPPITLWLGDSGADYVVLNWSQSSYNNFESAQIAHIEAGTVIFQDWNHTSTTGIPLLNNAAEILEPRLTEASFRSVRIEGVNRALLNRYLVVVKGLVGHYGYSNELAVAAIVP